MSTKEAVEELTNGMALCNAVLEQLGHKIKAEEIIMVSAKAEGEEALLGLLNKNNSIPHVHCAIMYPSHPRLSKWKSQRIVTTATATRSSCVL